MISTGGLTFSSPISIANFSWRDRFPSSYSTAVETASGQRNLRNPIKVFVQYPRENRGGRTGTDLVMASAIIFFRRYHHSLILSFTYQFVLGRITISVCTYICFNFAIWPIKKRVWYNNNIIGLIIKRLWVWLLSCNSCASLSFSCFSYFIRNP